MRGGASQHPTQEPRLRDLLCPWVGRPQGPLTRPPGVLARGGGNSTGREPACGELVWCPLEPRGSIGVPSERPQPCGLSCLTRRLSPGSEQVRARDTGRLSTWVGIVGTGPSGAGMGPGRGGASAGDPGPLSPGSRGRPALKERRLRGDRLRGGRTWGLPGCRGALGGCGDPIAAHGVNRMNRVPAWPRRSEPRVPTTPGSARAPGCGGEGTGVALSRSTARGGEERSLSAARLPGGALGSWKVKSSPPAPPARVPAAVRGHFRHSRSERVSASLKAAQQAGPLTGHTVSWGPRWPRAQWGPLPAALGAWRVLEVQRPPQGCTPGTGAARI